MEISRKLDFFMPHYKMGIKILDDVQLKNIFPTYDHLLGKIETHRAHIRGLEPETLNLGYQYNLMYDNVFAILGKRGSGKTSSIFTLKAMLERNRSDYVLPIVIPDLIPKNGNIIGWILAILEDVIQDLESEIRKNAGPSENNKFFKNCMFNPDNTLRRKYQKVKELSFSQNYNPRQEPSFSVAVGNSVQQARNSYEFSKCLAEFWTELKDAIRIARKLESSQVPLLYIMFDDVDLTPNMVEELLSTMLKYLSHPNIIIITTADEELFLKVIDNNIKKKINDFSSEIDEKIYNIIDRFDRHSAGFYSELGIEQGQPQNLQRVESSTARLYLDKILPPSSRYYLENFTSCYHKKNFIERVEKPTEGTDAALSGADIISRKDAPQRLYQILGRMTAEFARFCQGRKNQIMAVDHPEEASGYHSKDGYSEDGSFLYYKKNFLDIYFMFFGSTSRQILNEYFIMEELFVNLLKRLRCYAGGGEGNDQAEYENWLYHQIYHFIYGSVNANGELKEKIAYIDEFVQHVFLREYNEWPLYINYQYLVDRFNKYKEDYDRDLEELSAEIKDTVALFMLLFFAENVLLLIDKSGYPVSRERNHLHGSKELVAFCNSLTSGDTLIRRMNSTEEMLYVYEQILEYPDRFVHFDCNDSRKAHQYLYMLNARMDNVRGGREKLTPANMYKWCLAEHKEWFHTMVRIVSMSYGDVYLIDRAAMKMMDFSTMFPYEAGFLKLACSGIEADIQAYVGRMDLLGDYDPDPDRIFIELRAAGPRDAVRKQNGPMSLIPENLPTLSKGLTLSLSEYYEYLTEHYGGRSAFLQSSDLERQYREFMGRNKYETADFETLFEFYDQFRIKLIELNSHFNYYVVVNTDALQEAFDSLKFTTPVVMSMIKKIKTAINVWEESRADDAEYSEEPEEVSEEGWPVVEYGLFSQLLQELYNYIHTKNGSAKHGAWELNPEQQNRQNAENAYYQILQSVDIAVMQSESSRVRALEFLQNYENCHFLLPRVLDRYIWELRRKKDIRSSAVLESRDYMRRLYELLCTVAYPSADAALPATQLYVQSVINTEVSKSRLLYFKKIRDPENDQNGQDNTEEW